MVKERIARILNDACARCISKGLFDLSAPIEPHVEIPRDEGLGDYSTNLAFILAPKLKKPPLEIARILKLEMDYEGVCETVSVAGKGFINFYVKDVIWKEAFLELYKEGIGGFMPDFGRGRPVLIEFVSANPTGPLHVGHGRGAVVGDVLANILRCAGYRVTKEYYVNDAGRQMLTLGESVYMRWRQLKGEDVEYKDYLYQGEYIKEIARGLIEKGVALPEAAGEAIRYLADYASKTIMDWIVADLEGFGVHFDNYYMESKLYRDGIVDETLMRLKEKGFVYEKDGALWFKTSLFEKAEDRVLIKSDGEKTYFASDIAYHWDKIKRGYELLIDIWGSDHHGYIPRLKAAIEAIGGNKDDLKVILIQFATLIREGRPIGMSTRSGEFTTLKEVIDEVGKDASRFFFLMRKADAHLEFDLDLAKKTSNDNPVYYVQYANARIESIFRLAKEDGIDLNVLGLADIALLSLKEEISIIKSIIHFYDVLEGSAKSLEPHRMTFYLIDLAARFHSYYNKTRVLKNDIPLTSARLLLLFVLQMVLKYGLNDIMGVSTPERM